MSLKYGDSDISVSHVGVRIGHQYRKLVINTNRTILTLLTNIMVIKVSSSLQASDFYNGLKKYSSSLLFFLKASYLLENQNVLI